MLKFQQQAKLQYGLHSIHIVPMINVVFLLLIFYLLTSPLTFQSGINVKLPKSVTSDVLKQESVVVTITGENVIYLNNALVTVKELKAELSKPNSPHRPVLIKADRRTSVGRIVDVWNLCRAAGIERINIATNQNQ